MGASLVVGLGQALEPWAAFYGDHATLSTAVLAGHLLALFVGGGVAVAADRTVLRATPVTPDDHRRVLADLAGTHTLVVALLAVTVATGGLMAAADVATYAASPVYWTKMGVFALLLANGVQLRRAETAVRTEVTSWGSTEGAPAPPAAPRSWGAVRRAAWRSLAAWCALVLLGVVLSNG